MTRARKPRAKTSKAKDFLHEERTRIVQALRQLEASEEQIRNQLQNTTLQVQELNSRLKDIDGALADA